MSYASQLGTFSVTIKRKIFSLALPIFICSVLSGVFSWVIFGYFNSDGGGGAPPATPIPSDTPVNAILNALFYVVIAFVGATVIFLIFKYGKISLLKALFAFAIAITSFFFVFLLILAAPYYLAFQFKSVTQFSPTTDLIILIAGIILGLAYAAFTVTSMVYQLTPQPFPQIMAMLFAVLSGTFLATFLPLFASIFVMIGLSIYDIISVFRGPIKKIAEVSEQRYTEKNAEIVSVEEKERESGESSERKTMEKEDVSEQPVVEESVALTALAEDSITSNNSSPAEQANPEEETEYLIGDYIELGLGDLAFFGMLFSFGLIRLGFFAALAAFVGVVLGAAGTIKLLEKVKMMPGLPLSIGLGLIFAFGMWGILALVGYTGWGWQALL